MGHPVGGGPDEGPRAPDALRCIISRYADSAWSVLAATHDLNWAGVSMSSTGEYQTAVENGACDCSGGCVGFIHRSTDFGAAWTKVNPGGTMPAKNWRHVVVSASGQFQTAAAFKDSVYHSNNFGETWATLASGSLTTGEDADLYSLAMSGDGQRQLGGGFNVHTFVWGGSTMPGGAPTGPAPPAPPAPVAPTATSDWAKVTDATIAAASAVLASNPIPAFIDGAVSADGRYQTLLVSQGNLLRPTDYGASWSVVTLGLDSGITYTWRRVAMSGDGKYQTATLNRLGGAAPPP